MASTSAVNRLLLLPTSSSSSSGVGVGVGWQSLLVRRGRRRGGVSLVAAAKKKNRSRSKKEREREDESFFPEAVLLRKKSLQEPEGAQAQLLPQFADAQQEKLYQALSLELETDLNLERMRHYEVVFLIHEKHDDEVEQIVTKVEDFIREMKGRIWRVNDWGLRRLAYEVKKAMQAHYILMNFEIDAKFVNDFKTMLDKDERVIRHLVTKEEKAQTEYCPPPMEYHTLLAKQGYGDDDDGFWDDDGFAMYGDGDDGDYDDEDYVDDSDDASGEDDGEVIYVDRDREHDESRGAAKF